jgi:hypothetical protein
MVERAVHYWQQAGANAARRHVHQDAIAAVTKGLALLATLPQSPERTQRELTLQLSLGGLLMAVHGMTFPEAGDAYTRAHVLCQQLGETPQRFQVLQGLYLFHEAQAQLHTAGGLAQQLTHLAQRQPEAGLGLEGQSAMGSVARYRGDLMAARVHLEHCLSLGTTPQPRPSVVGIISGSKTSACWRKSSGDWAMPIRPSSGVQRRWPWPSR